jgi:hypothetical protein
MGIGLQQFVVTMARRRWVANYARTGEPASWLPPRGGGYPPAVSRIASAPPLPVNPTPKPPKLVLPKQAVRAYGIVGAERFGRAVV